MVNLITNGSFEIGQDPGVNINLGFNSTAINNWVVTDDNIDYVGSDWQASDGNRSLDLDGFEPGAIAQSFNTIIGQNYLVTFDLAGNPVGDPNIKTMRVEAGGQSAAFIFDTTGKNRGIMGWDRRSWEFTATATQTTLQFRSLTNGTAFGPALDNVRVEAALPTINLRVTPVSVTEDGATNLVYTFTRTGGNLTTPLDNVNFTIGGTAGFNSDYIQRGAASYTATTGTVNFAANSATATVTIDPTADTLVEPNETAILTLNNGTGYTLGTPNTATGTITNDDVAGTNVTLGVNYSAISENSPNNVIYTFTRTGLLNNPLTVNYTVGGTATGGDDYAQIANSVTFAANSATATIIVNPTEDTIVEPNETVILTLSNGTDYSIGTTNPVTTTILNDDGTRRQVGTSGNDNLVGTNKGDILIGGLRNDLITGGGSNDLFTFGALNEGIDTITDFTVGDDLIVVRGSTFGGGLISGDSIQPNQLIIGTVATNPNNRFIYNSGTGALSFDRDGNGSATPTQFATLNRNLALTFEDIFVS
jgi:choice-of-anchor C domain-containing protein